MSAKHTPEVRVMKVTSHGTDMGYLKLIHRHFEKSLPVGEKKGDGVHYTAPVDLLALTLPPEEVEQIAEVELVYAK